MIKFIKGDITKINDVDAIVNAANKTLLGGGGVDGAIHRADGIKLRLECLKLHGCKTGEAKITGAYNLSCKYIIHTVGPIWHNGTNNEDIKLRNCYYNSLEIAKENGIRKIAFPSISTGVFRFPIELASEIAIETVKEFLEKNIGVFDLVEWVLFDDETYSIYTKKAKELEVYK